MQTKANLSSFVLMVECALSRHGVQYYVMHHPFTVLFFLLWGQLTSEEMTIDLARNIFNRVPVSLNFVLFLLSAERYHQSKWMSHVKSKHSQANSSGNRN